jgi:hypothetical protein
MDSCKFVALCRGSMCFAVHASPSMKTVKRPE